jgi:hypothetical protein
MKQTGHLDDDVLVRAIDDELSLSEHLALDSHVAVCEACKARFEELRMLSMRIDSLVASLPVAAAPEFREKLTRELETREAHRSLPKRSMGFGHRLGWGMALAASLAVSAIFLPHAGRLPTSVQSAQSGQAANGTMEVEGESFVSLPYSNSDLPVNTLRIVRMQVPVSSLVDAGVIFEPVSSEAGMTDRSVLADVLIGIDGEPLGVHIIGSE